MIILKKIHQKAVLTCLTFLTLTGLLLSAQACAQAQNQEQNQSETQTVEVAQPLPPPEPLVSVLVPVESFNGQAFMLKVVSPTLEQINFTWAGKSLSVVAEPTENGNFEAIALIPVDLDTKPQIRKLDLTITDAGKELKESIDIQISKKKYPQQQLSVNPKFVHLSDADLKRSQAERKRTNAILSVRSPERLWELPFVRPVPGTVSSLFGVSRIFNGVPRNAHKGLDLRGATGTPIKACAAGKVVLADNLFFSGNVVYLDHGLGVFTMYAHMSKMLVSEGDIVQAGEVIGEVGATGRVTGPHLHLTANVMGTSVDAEILIGANMAIPLPESTPETKAMPATNSTIIQ